MKTNDSLVPAQNGHLLALAFEGKSVRILERNGDPWFLSNDVGEVLGLTNIRDWVYKLDDDQKASLQGDSFGGLRANTTVISESGLYELIFRSSKPEAKRFRKWVTSEVLPQIRKTGGYVAPAAAGLGKLESALVDLAREHDSRIAELEASARPGDDWLTVTEYCEAHGIELNGGRRAKVSMLASHRSGRDGVPVGLRVQRRVTVNGRYYQAKRPTFSPRILGEVIEAKMAQWRKKGAQPA